MGNFDNVWVDAAKSDCDFIFIHNEILNLTQDYSTKFFDPEYSESIAGYLEEQIESLKSIIRSKESTKVISTSLSSFTLGLRRLNPVVSELCNRYNQSIHSISSSVIDFSRLLCEVGLKSAINWSSLYRFSAPYEHEFLRLLASNLASEILRLLFGNKKVLIVDLDNTIWGGILGEDGADNLVLGENSPKGKCYEEVQKLMINLSSRGTILAVCSKNNYSDVEKLFEIKKMPISLELFSVKSINWNDKPINIKDIAKELNLDTESFVFLDDSDHEVASVVAKLPNVQTFKVPENIFRYPYWFRNELLPSFSIESNTEEDLNRKEYYNTETIRKHAQVEFDNETDFIASLELKLTMQIENLDGVARVAQMTNKTNQFNLTTRRYSQDDITMMIDDENYLVVSGNVQDRFGDSGKTLLAIVKDCLSEKPYIDTFLMSCRVIGKGIEFAFLKNLVNHISENYNSNIVTAEYIATHKNSQTADFYNKFGFETTEQKSESTYYSLIVKDFDPKLERNINVEFIY